MVWAAPYFRVEWDTILNYGRYYDWNLTESREQMQNLPTDLDNTVFDLHNAGIEICIWPRDFEFFSHENIKGFRDFGVMWYISKTV